MSAIQEYSKKDIIAFISDHYRIPIVSVTVTRGGIDNSVYILETENKTRYIFKVVETKSDEQIKCSIEQAKSLTAAFSQIDYMRDKDGSTVLPFVNGKPCFLYKYREGKVFSVNSDADVKRAAEFIRDFHSQNITSAIRGEVVFEEFKKELNIYRSQKVKEGIDKDFKEIFQGLNELVDKVYEALPFLERMAKPIITKGGLVHSDFTPDNVLVNGEKLELIDFDSIKENGMQIIDLLQFASKSGIAEDKNRLSNFFNTYSDRSEHPPEDLRAFQALLLMFSVKALLSTLYYTYDVGKADVEWVKRNSMQTLEPLYKCATSLHRELIP